MKNIFIIFFTIVYLGFSSGLAFEIHHCMGEFADLSLVPAGKKNCGKCGMPKGVNGCCKDELKFVKLQDSQKLINADYNVSIPIAFISSRYFLLNQSFQNRQSFGEYNNHSPPDFTGTSHCIINCVFRI